MNLTRKRIMSATDEQLNKWTAIFIMNWHVKIKTAIIGGVRFKFSKWIDENGIAIEIKKWQPSNDINGHVDSYLLEERIKEMELIFNYTFELWKIVSNQEKCVTNCFTAEDQFKLAHSNPKQKTIAALLAVIKE